MDKQQGLTIPQDGHALSSAAARYVRASKSANTRRAYRFGWEDFSDWCRRAGRRALPASPATVAEYLRVLAEVDRVSTLQVKLAAVSFAHETASLPDPADSPEVKAVMSGIRRELGTAPNKKAPITRDDLERMVAALPDTLTGRRDRALLLVGFAGAFRRSELAALDVRQIVFLDDQAVITLLRSKTDPEGRGSKKHLPRTGGELCPVTALRAWLLEARIASGPVFRKVDRWGKVGARKINDGTVAQVVKVAAERIGLDPARVSGHSLRSGFITSAAEIGEDEWKIQQVSQHKSTAVLRGYIQDAGRGGMEAVRNVLRVKGKR